MIPAANFRDVSKSFGSVDVLKNFNLTVTPGENLVIIGPSGSGKSTILRILMTLESIDQGVVEVNGEMLCHMEKKGKVVPADEAHLRKMRTSMGMVFQHFNLFPHMTVLRNITEAPRRVLGIPREEAVSRAKELLDMVGLADKADSFPGQLSGGQKQRVGIARALAMEPKLLLLDEITSALDPELVGEVLDVIGALAKKHDYTMIIVTHEMYFAREIADRVVFLDHGVVVEEGEPSVIFSKPKEERTREFIKTFLSLAN